MSKPLDPKPWIVYPNGESTLRITTYEFLKDGWVKYKFSPRPGFEEDRSKYAE